MVSLNPGFPRREKRDARCETEPVSVVSSDRAAGPKTSEFVRLFRSFSLLSRQRMRPDNLFSLFQKPNSYSIPVCFTLKKTSLLLRDLQRDCNPPSARHCIVALDAVRDLLASAHITFLFTT